MASDKCGKHKTENNYPKNGLLKTSVGTHNTCRQTCEIGCLARSYDLILIGFWLHSKFPFILDSVTSILICFYLDVTSLCIALFQTYHVPTSVWSLSCKLHFFVSICSFLKTFKTFTNFSHTLYLSIYLFIKEK